MRLAEVCFAGCAWPVSHAPSGSMCLGLADGDAEALTKEAWMRAAVLHELGATPEVESDHARPTGSEGVHVDVLAAGINPVDVTIAAGKFPGMEPQLPSVVGREGVGTTEDGRRVYFDMSVAGWGSLAEATMVPPGRTFDLREDIDPGLATAFGIAGIAAWCGLEFRGQLQEGETVVVLGASGVVGSIATQAARHLGAGRVVAAARDAAALQRLQELGAADATIIIDDLDALPDQIREAAQAPRGVDLIIDPLWGAPAVAAIRAIRSLGRLVQIGHAAGPEATIPARIVRNPMVDIRGYTSFEVPADVHEAAFHRMIDLAADGKLSVPLRRFSLDDAADAWRAQADGSQHEKLVVIP